MNDPLLGYRSEFPILDRPTTSSPTRSAPCRGRRDAMRDYAETWATRGVRAWAEGWWELARDVGDRDRRLFSAPPGSVSMHQNVTIAEAIVVSCFDFSGRRNSVVYTDLNFPSVQVPLGGGAGARRERAPGAVTDGIGRHHRAAARGDRRRTLLVPISHVLFRSAFIQDAEAIVEQAHGSARTWSSTPTSRPAPCRSTCGVCASTSPAAAPEVAVRRAGRGFLYVRPDLGSTLAAAFTGWQAHPEPFAFAVGPMRYADAAYRFLHGTPNVPALYAARPGFDIVSEVGVERIREKSTPDRPAPRARARAGLARQHAARPGAARRDGARRLRPRHEVSRELLAREVLVD